MQEWQKARKSGFTLIELLVVIAIIAVLASILFPVFAAAQKMAKRSTCANNLKQLSSSVIIYKNDWSGWYPFAGGREVGADRSIEWQNAITKYVKTDAVFRCPSTTMPGVNPADPSETNLNGDISKPRTPVTYLMNGYLGLDQDAFGYGIQRTHNDSQLQRPTWTILFMEGCPTPQEVQMNGVDARGRQHTLWLRPYSFAKRAGNSMAGANKTPWHQDGGNVAFCDGHVKYIKYTNYRNLEAALPWLKNACLYQTGGDPNTDVWQE